VVVRVKGQSSIEMLALTALFVSLLVPLLLFLFSSSTQLSEKGSLEGARNTLFVLKEKMEYAYAFCPYRETFLVSVPSSVEGISVQEGPEGFLLVANTTYGQVVEALAIHEANVDVELKGGAFAQPVEVVCRKGLGKPFLAVKEGEP